MVAIALDKLEIDRRNGTRYPILILRDDSGAEVELYVRQDPREAFIRLAGLERAVSAHQGRLPVTKIFQPYRSKP